MNTVHIECSNVCSISKINEYQSLQVCMHCVDKTGYHTFVLNTPCFDQCTLILEAHLVTPLKQPNFQTLASF